MKAQLIGNKKGFATLEILIAFTVIILCISAVVLVIFSNQSLTIDTQTNTEAVSKAQALLEKARADSRFDFGSVISNTSIDGIYTEILDVPDPAPAPCKKKVSSTVVWNTGSRNLSTTFSTFVGDVAGVLALGGDCQTETPSDDWNNPDTYTSGDINPGGNEGTGLDVIKISGHTYAFLTSVHSNSASSDFWVFDVEVGPSSVLAPIQSLNNGAGLNGVDVARDSVTGNTYAFVLENGNSEQLKVINVTNPTNPNYISSANRTLPNIVFTCSPVSDPCLAGKSIYFYNGYVYIGTNYLANLSVPITKNNEFHVFCVFDRNVSGCTPETPVWVGSYNVNHNVNSINVEGSTAYLATSDDNEELKSYNISSFNSISPIQFYNAAGSEDGTSVDVVGTKIYLGRKKTASSRPELYILNKNNFSVISSKNINLSPSAAILDIAVISKFVFLGTSDTNKEFQVWKSDNLSTVWSTFNFPQAITGIEYFENKIYASVKSNNALHIIYDAP